jgi:uncharacterized membrane protein
MLVRVDILNIMGPALVAVGLLWGATRTTRGMVWACAAITLAIATVTPVVRTATALDVLPLWVQWYLRPAGEQTTFVAFPWAGFVFAGAAVGALVAAADGVGCERRVQLGVAATGAGLVAIGLYTATKPSIYAQSSFWTSSPTYFAIRVGILMLLLPLSSVVDRMSRERTTIASVLQPLEALGRSSLFVYWIHVELVYGYATWPIHNRLPLAAAIGAWGAFSALMYAAVAAKERIRHWRPAVVGPGGISGEGLGQLTN